MIASERKVYVVEWKSEVTGSWYPISAWVFRSFAWRKLWQSREEFQSTEKKSNFRVTPYSSTKEAHIGSEESQLRAALSSHSVSGEREKELEAALRGVLGFCDQSSDGETEYERAVLKAQEVLKRPLLASSSAKPEEMEEVYMRIDRVLDDSAVPTSTEGDGKHSKWLTTWSRVQWLIQRNAELEAQLAQKEGK